MIRMLLKNRRNSRKRVGHVADPAAWFGTEIGFLGLLTAVQRPLRSAATDDDGGTDSDACAYAPCRCRRRLVIICRQYSYQRTYSTISVSSFKSNITSDPTHPISCHLSLCFLAAWPASLTSAAQTLKDEPVPSRITEGAIPL